MDVLGALLDTTIEIPVWLFPTWLFGVFVFRRARRFWRERPREPELWVTVIEDHQVRQLANLTPSANRANRVLSRFDLAVHDDTERFENAAD